MGAAGREHGHAVFHGADLLPAQHVSIEAPRHLDVTDVEDDVSELLDFHSAMPPYLRLVGRTLARRPCFSNAGPTGLPSAPPRGSSDGRS